MPPRATHPVPTPTALPEIGYVRLPLVLQVYPIGKSTWWAGVKAGKYPAPVKLGPRVSAWRVDDIRELLSKLASCEAR
jgi:predicted DNA-binding transcriptional regulator AlpA